MASSMKPWLAAVFVGFAVLLIWALPVEWRINSGQQIRTSEEIRAQQLGAELRKATEVYRRIVWADSVVPMVTGSTPPPAALIVHDGHLPEAQKDRYVQMVEAEVEALGPRSDMRFAAVLLDRTIGRRPETGSGGFDRSETFVGTENGHPYCLQLRIVNEGDALVHTVARELAGLDHVLPVSNSLGPCAFYLRYGVPGERVEAWLALGGAAMAQERGDEERPALRLRSRSLLGMRWGDRPFDIDRCYTGDAPSCDQVFEQGRSRDRVIARNLEIAEHSPALWPGYRSGWHQISSDDGWLLFDLEEEFGEEAFSRFWTSDEEILPAFESAFGISAGEWLVSWISQRSELDSRGPALHRAATSGSVAFIFVLLLLAFSQQRKRRVVA